jgi:peptidoglycan hydrolase-like protein with peptidoglycan-binding domain
MAVSEQQSTLPLLRIASEGPHVLALQQQLARLGVLTKDADGLFGVETEEAVRRFQSWNELIPDGMVGPDTWEALRRSGLDTATLPPPRRSSGTPRPFFRVGSRGPHVRAVQEHLARTSQLTAPADGLFGPDTERAVRSFQSGNDLPADGIVGPDTWEALRRHGLDDLDLPPFGGSQPTAVSGSVRGMASQLPAGPVTPFDVVAGCLQTHPEYAKNRAGEFELGETPPDADRKFLIDWLGEVRPMFDAARVTELHTRHVVLGMALLNGELLARLYRDDFLEALMSESRVDPRTVLARDKPEPNIARDYWTREDRLGYRPYADAIAAFIRHPETRPPLTIGVKAPWGAGKTSLMRMVQDRLDPRRDEDAKEAIPLQLVRGAKPVKHRRVRNLYLLSRASGADSARLSVKDWDIELGEDPPLRKDEWRPTVWFNPWMYQSGEQIWAGLAHEIIEQVTERLDTPDRERFWLQLNLRRLDREAVRRRVYRALLERFIPLLLVFVIAAALALIARLAEWTSGAAAILGGGSGLVVLLGIVQTARFLAATTSSSFEELVSEPDMMGHALKREAGGAFRELIRDPGYESRLGFLYLVQTDMRIVLDLIATDDRPLVVFVDDLDRCSPGAVAQVIEAINLFLAGEFPNCVFVLAVEPAMVAAHVEVAYQALVANLKDDDVPSDWSALGWRFLEKIVQLPLSLPLPESRRRLRHYVDSLLTAPPKRPRDRGAASRPRGPRPPKPAPPPHDVARPGPDDEREAPRPSAAPTSRAKRERQEGGTYSLELVDRIEAAIRRRAPTGQQLPAAAREAQDEVLGERRSELAREAVEAANRVFAELYSDANARHAIDRGARLLGSQNPREIKRFVNLFRFYTFIVEQRRLHAPPDGDQGAGPDALQVAKLAALAIRWPQLLNALGRAVPQEKVTALAYLERKARDGGATDPWAAALVTAHLRRATSELESAWAVELRRFLREEPEISDTALALL